MKKLILFINIFLVAGVSQGQQLMTSSLYDQHGNLHNPATAGSAKHAMIGASYRKT